YVHVVNSRVRAFGHASLLRAVRELHGRRGGFLEALHLCREPGNDRPGFGRKLRFIGGRIDPEGAAAVGERELTLKLFGCFLERRTINTSGGYRRRVPRRPCIVLSKRVA